MPPKGKKKAGLKDEQVQVTINVVRQNWPQYEITPACIKNPTRTFVLKFYNDCVQDLMQKLSFATNIQLLPHPPGLSEEELIFLKLSRIPALVEADFQLGDLYTFDPIRVNSHIYIIMHFLLFSDSIMEKTLQFCKQVFDAKEQMERNEEELQKLKQEKLEKEIQFTEIKAEKKKVKEIAAALAPEYETTVACLEEIEKKCKGKVEEIDKLNSELENIQAEIQNREKAELHLKNQIVTEGEYSSLKNTLKSLETEEKNLEEIDLSNGLLEQKQNMEHLQMCLRELNHLKLSEDIFKLSKYRGQLTDEKESLQYALNLQKNSESEISVLEFQLDNEKRAVEIENRDLQEKLRTITHEGTTKENKLKKTFQQMNKDNQGKITEQQRVSEKREADYTELQKNLKEKYNEIRQKQDMALQRFKDFMNKVNNASEDDV